MKFYEHRLLRSGYEAVYRASGIPIPKAEFYPMAFAEAAAQRSDRGMAQLRLEQEWEQAKRPYYSVYPGILEALLRINLDLDTSLIRPPLPRLSIRLPEKQDILAFDWKGERIQCREIFFGEIITPKSEDVLPGRFDIAECDGDGLPPGCCRGLSVWVDIGECVSCADPRLVEIANHVPIQSYRNIRLLDGLRADTEISSMRLDPSALEGIVMPMETWQNVFRLVFTLCLLENDPDIIAPDVLSKDEAKFEATGDQKYVDKAHRRHKRGWKIGHRLEVIPHYRRPHPFKVWVGKGRREAKIVMRRGSIVHREIVEKLPTGYGANG